MPFLNCNMNNKYIKEKIEVAINVDEQIIDKFLEREYELSKDGWVPSEDKLIININLQPGSQEPDTQSEISTSLE